MEPDNAAGGSAHRHGAPRKRHARASDNAAKRQRTPAAQAKQQPPPEVILVEDDEPAIAAPPTSRAEDEPAPAAAATASKNQRADDDEPTVANINERWNVYMQNHPDAVADGTDADADDGPVAELKRLLVEHNKPAKVAVMGTMASGKSTLLNRLTGLNVLPTSGGAKACTAVPCVIRPGKKLQVILEFYDSKSWLDKRSTMAQVVYEFRRQEGGEESTTDDDEGEDADKEGDEDEEPSEEVLAEVRNAKTPREAQEELEAVYGSEQLYKNHDTLLKRLRRESPAVEEKWVLEKLEAGRTPPREFPTEEAARTYLAGVLSVEGNREAEDKKLTPLLRRVTVEGPMPDIPRNVSFVDLPGYNDCSKYRRQLHLEALVRCEQLWWVAHEGQRIASDAASDKMAQRVIRDNPSLFQTCHVIYTKMDLFSGDENELVSQTVTALRDWWDSFQRRALKQTKKLLQFKPTIENVILSAFPPRQDKCKGLEKLRTSIWRIDSAHKPIREYLAACISMRTSDPGAKLPDFPEEAANPEEGGHGVSATFHAVEAIIVRLQQLLDPGKHSRFKSDFYKAATSFSEKKLEGRVPQAVKLFMAAKGTYDQKRKPIHLFDALMKPLNELYKEIEADLLVAVRSAKKSVRLLLPDKDKTRCDELFKPLVYLYEHAGLMTRAQQALEEGCENPETVFIPLSGRKSKARMLENFTNVMNERKDTLFQAATTTMVSMLRTTLDLCLSRCTSLLTEKADKTESRPAFLGISKVAEAVRFNTGKGDVECSNKANELFNCLKLKLKSDRQRNQRMLALAQAFLRNKDLCCKFVNNLVPPLRICDTNPRELQKKIFNVDNSASESEAEPPPPPRTLRRLRVHTATVPLPVTPGTLCPTCNKKAKHHETTMVGSKMVTICTCPDGHRWREGEA
eukprot:TRINITY_DN4821_c0_g1_i2.p1 TRINITY_DN4821_c0_g1~~TRINITY_DN4821_c0_g1_i2.p1  ORF type:complete len:919 (-),score=236.91 TRINITY_DN4821_c0_g1_i2:107-2839(-)